jgi:manganese/zinc/iron transport system ATP- binding protein
VSAAPGRPAALSVNDLTVAYRERPVLWDIDLEIPEGLLVAIAGPNGAGKTTLIKAVLGLLRPLAGNIRIFGHPAAEARRRIGYLPQRGSVDWDFPTSVLDLVLMGSYGRLGWLRRPGRREREEAMSALERVGMSEFAQRQISRLSGGQQQRAFLARALMQQSDLYLMDEPFAAVDAATERAIVEVLKELRAQGKTLLVVHHGLQQLREYFDWALLLNVRRIALGPVDEVLTPDNIAQAYGARAAFLGTAQLDADISALRIREGGTGTTPGSASRGGGAA